MRGALMGTVFLREIFQLGVSRQTTCPPLSTCAPPPPYRQSAWSFTANNLPAAFNLRSSAVKLQAIREADSRLPFSPLILILINNRKKSLSGPFALSAF
jgi:hypothetical protein